MNPFTNFYVDPITKHYADFNGEASREAFWMFTLINFLIGIAVSVVATLLHVRPLAGLYSLAVLLPHLAIGARRLHDGGYSALWLLLWLVPIIGWLALIILYCLPSKTPPYGG
jgi:uncharacterized membrane protein YhaH (DUF805 family)